MAPEDWQDWVAWAGVVLPLMTIAWSAWSYSQTRKRETQHREYERFFEVMDHLGQQGGSIASKMAAAYELRKYPEYKEVIIRMCETVQTSGHDSSAKMLKSELEATAKHLRSK
jgi:hypothetical protein